MTHRWGFSLWNSRNAILLLSRNLSRQESKKICAWLILLWFGLTAAIFMKLKYLDLYELYHRKKHIERISGSCSQSGNKVTLKLINKCKKGLLSKASAVLIIWGILPDMLIMRLRAKDCWDQIMRNLHGAVLKCWWVCWGTEVGMPEIVRGWTHNIGRCPPRSPGTWTIPHQGLQSYGYGEFF